MSSMSQELAFLMLQCLDDANYKQTMHKLEMESGAFFNMRFVEENVANGKWDELVEYVSRFTKFGDNEYSGEIFSVISKQKDSESSDRENGQLTSHGDGFRSSMLTKLKRLIEANPLLREKLVFPLLKPSQLCTLINQSLKWHNQLCKNPRLRPDLKTLFTDHTCAPYYGSGGLLVDEVACLVCRPQLAWSEDNLPRAVACSLTNGSAVTGMDFHPKQSTLLIVGAANGEITLWDIDSQMKLVTKPFKIWKPHACSLQKGSVKDSSIAVNKVTWSPDGSLTGVAFTKNLIHLHGYRAPNKLDEVLEIVASKVEAHTGGVNDVTFFQLDQKLCVISCGDDELIKVWNFNGQILYVFEGHKAPVYSLCPHQKEGVQFLLSTSLDGKIKAWFYDDVGSVLHCDAPGRSYISMLYSADGSRLFSCGADKDGNYFLIEWSEGSIKKTYTGPRRKLTKVVKFDTAQNKFLAAADGNLIKFWDVDDVNMLVSVEVESELPIRPYLKFNKEGNLLAVTTADCGFKILANADGLRTLQGSTSHPFEAIKGNIVPREVDKPRISEDLPDKHKSWELTEIVDPRQCRVATMPDNTYLSAKVRGLLYTNSGDGLLALASNGNLRLWKWSNEQNPNGKATTNVLPQHWLPKNGLLMTNDASSVDTEDAVPCLAISPDDAFVVSSRGGRISLFKMSKEEFQASVISLRPPPASTFLAYHLKKILAIGREDSTILVFHVTKDKSVKNMVLKGHQKRISGLAFSTRLRILVSSDADAQLCIWSLETWPWEKKKSVSIPVLHSEKILAHDTWVQFSSDQSRLLVVHERQLAIFEASKLEPIHQWLPQDSLSAPVAHASYSCDSKLVYVSFTNGNIGIFDSDPLRLRCRIAPSVYLSTVLANSKPAAHPLVIAAHPENPNQFAVGLTNGAVKVMEPLQSDGKWGASPLET